MAWFDDVGSHDRADTEDLCAGRLGRGDDSGDASFGVGPLLIEGDEVGQQVTGEVVAGGANRSLGLELVEHLCCLCCIDLPGIAAGDQLA